MKKKPDFLIVGAAKSGTTSLFHYLKQHPDIYIPEVKECRFFSQLPKNYKGLGAEFFPNSGITDKDEYFGLFEGRGNKICGDISNDYLYYYKESIGNIKKYLGDEVKIIIILRNPVDRAYSNYMHAFRDGWENITFEDSIIEETSRINDNWGWPYHYINTGFYYLQVKAYLDSFSDVKVFLFEELKDNDTFMKSIFGFLGVNSCDLPVSKEMHNESGYPKSKVIHKLVNYNGKLKEFLKPIAKTILPNNILNEIKNKNLIKKEINKKTRVYLNAMYSDDVTNLAKLIKKDLSYWVKDEV